MIWIIAGIVGVVVLLLVVTLIYYWNKIIGLSNRIKNSWAQIDVQLKKRADLVPNLVETVKGYATHERAIFENVSKARSAMMGAQTVEQKAKADNMLTGALKTLFAVAENYPTLKANENFKLLQEQLDGIESKIAYARQFYNDSVLEYNNTIQMFPGRIFAGWMGKKTEQYFEIAETERAVPKVKF
ncbi:MAG: LemA family protein [Candidatus Altiarchaeota archaeon]|nr:LemA family protein [Candidatus Altiarchaeota archaeon]